MPSVSSSFYRLACRNVNFWTLQGLVENQQEFLEEALNEAPALPIHFLDGFMRNVSLFAAQIRHAFPTGLMMMQTSAPVQGSQRLWTKHGRMHVTQLNAALRMVAKHLHMPVVDFERMMLSFAPENYTYDGMYHGLSLAGCSNLMYVCMLMMISFISHPT